LDFIFPRRFPARSLVDHAAAELLAIPLPILSIQIGKLLEDLLLGAHTSFLWREYPLIPACVIDATRADIQVLLHQINVLGGICVLLLLLRESLIPIASLPLD
jgi:hypothetical protein